MNKFKMGLLLFLIIIVSGCKIRSNITLFPDGTVSEKVIVTEKKDKSLEINYSEYLNEEIEIRKPLIDYGKNSKPNIDYKAFTTELLKKIGE